MYTSFINYTCCFLRSLGILSGNATEEKKQIAQKWKTVIKHLIKEKPITKSEGTCKYSFGVLTDALACTVVECPSIFTPLNTLIVKIFFLGDANNLIVFPSAFLYYQ